jgi:hypothetical protein
LKKKNGFLTFLLSFIPGFGHFYVGYATRGFIFFASSITLTILSILADESNYLNPAIPLSALALLWLISIVDSLVLVDKINSRYYSYYYNNNGEINETYPNLTSKQSRTYKELLDPVSLEKQNRKIKSMLLSVIPGVGHLYLGLQRQGIELMLSFFMVFFLTDWLRLSIFMVFAPVIWFYSMFDVMHKVLGTKEMKDEDIFAIKLPVVKDFINRSKSRFLGWVLIGLGAVVIVNRVFFPAISNFIPPYYIDIFQTAIVAALFIYGGVKLVLIKENNVVEE